MLSKSLTHTRHIASLTTYPQGSLRELWQISFPLMICLMSVSFMIFLDRLFLAHYSLDALNASVNAAMLAQLLQFWGITTVSIAEVFVGQYNGAGRKEKVGEPVWQMIWLAVGTTFFYVPIGLFAAPYLFHHPHYAELEVEYFTWLMCFGSFPALSGALCAFYIGRGKVKFITCVMVLANILNIILDIILIFGVESWVPPMGVKGAAIATGVAQMVQAAILFIAFYRKHNRREYGTRKWHFNSRMFFRCLKIGIPNAIAHTLELMAWVFIFDLMTQMGSDYITVVAVSQSILFLFTFLTDGMSKGATTIAANFIGSHQQDLVWKVLKSGIKFYLLLFLLLSGILAFYPEPLIAWFLPEDAHLSYATHASLCSACFWVWLFFLFDGISWLLVGLLTAAGDTKFIMKFGSVGPWLFALLPVYFFVVTKGASADVTWMIVAIYSLISCGVYLYRFKSEKWKQLVLLKT